MGDIIDGNRRLIVSIPLWRSAAEPVWAYASNQEDRLLGFAYVVNYADESAPMTPFSKRRGVK